MIPERLMLGVAKSKFEGYAPKYEREQHHENWKINCRNDDREGQREGGKQAETVKNANAEIESVE